MRRVLGCLRFLALLAGTAILVWCGGLVWFVLSSRQLATDPSRETDAIVVLTGGRLRLETGVELLTAGKAKKLFVSGVNARVDRDELLRAAGPAAEHAACCIVIGHAAADTYGNARETAEWMREEGYRSLRLVTSWYHMHRALLEFERAMPRITIVAHPVFASHVEPEHWWSWHGAVPLMVGEYGKYLAAWVRPLLVPFVQPPSPSEPRLRSADRPRPSAPLL
jgi:uncharacterized SAM-binding protein YcdF (DUF218 family)